MSVSSIIFDVIARDRASDTLDHVGSRAEHAGKLIGLAFGAASGIAIGEFLKGSLQAASDGDKLARVSENIVKTTGGAAKISADQIGALSDSLERKTGVDGDVIQSGANVLLTFTNIANQAGKGNDIFSQTVGIATDMATVLGGDASSAAVQLGKALNDPVQGISALSKAGVSFTAQQKDQIATFVKAGDTLDAQKVVLAELTKEFGGAAAAASTPLERLRGSLNQVQAVVGEQLLPVMNRAVTFLASNAGPALDITKRSFDDLSGAILPLVHVVEGLFHGLDGLVGSSDSAGTSASVLAGNATTLRVAIDAAVVAFTAYKVAQGLALVASGLTSAALFYQTATTYGLSYALEAGGLASKLYAAGTALAAAASTGFAAASTALGGALTIALGPVGLVILGVAALAAGLVFAYKNSETFRDIVNGAFDAVGKAGTFLWEQVLRPAFKFIIDEWLFVAGGILKGADAAFGWIPGIGGKLDSAVKAFDTFAHGVNAKLDGIDDKTIEIVAHTRITGATEDRAAGGTGSGNFNPNVNRRDGGPIGAMRALAAGGMLQGPGTGRSDSILGLDRGTGQPTAWVSDGEYVVNARSTQQYRPLIEAINAGRLANGGRVGVNVSADPNQLIGGIGSFYSNTVAMVTAVAQAAANAAAAKVATDGGGSAGTAQGSAQILSFIRSVDPLPYRWGATGPGAYDCSGLVGAVLDRMVGRNPYSRAFTTSTIHSGLYGLKPGTGGTLSIGVNPGEHMAGEYGGLGFEARSTATGIFTGQAAKKVNSFAVQYHLADGGLLGKVDELAKVFDIGGDPSGMTLNHRRSLHALAPLAFKNGGYIDEPVFGVGQMTGRSYSFGDGGRGETVTPGRPADSGPAVFHLYDTDGVLLGTIKGQIDAQDRKNRRGIRATVGT